MHFTIEFWAILSFLRQPHIQLHDPKPSREAVLICQSYAGTLLSLNLVCFMYLFFRGIKDFDEVSTALTWSLSVYHLFPMNRALDRMKRRRLAGSNYKSEYDIGGGPRGNFRGHCTIFLCLVSAGVYGLLSRAVSQWHARNDHQWSQASAWKVEREEGKNTSYYRRVGNNLSQGGNCTDSYTWMK